MTIPDRHTDPGKHSPHLLWDSHVNTALGYWQNVFSRLKTDFSGVTGPSNAVTAEKKDEYLPLGDIQL